MVGTLTEQMIDELLENNVIGRLGYTGDQKIYIVPVSYLFYNRKYIIAHSREGQKIDFLRKNPSVCLQVDQIDNMSNWQSVIVLGNYEELTDQRERYYALDLLRRRINKEKLAEKKVEFEQPQVEGSLILPDKEKSIVYRIRIESKSGRFERSDNMVKNE